MARKFPYQSTVRPEMKGKPIELDLNLWLTEGPGVNGRGII